MTFERELYDEAYWRGLHPHHWFRNPPRKYAERDRDVLRVVAPRPSESRASARTKPAARRTNHTVRRGETLFRIASRYGVTVDALRRANQIGRGHVIRPGQRLAVPTATR